MSLLFDSNEIMCVQTLVNQTNITHVGNSLGNVLLFQQQEIQTYLQRDMYYLRTSHWWQKKESESVSTIINERVA